MTLETEQEVAEQRTLTCSKTPPTVQACLLQMSSYRLQVSPLSMDRCCPFWGGYTGGKDWGFNSWVCGQMEERGRKRHGAMFPVTIHSDAIQWPMLCVSWRTGFWVEDNREPLTTHGAGSLAGIRNHRLCWAPFRFLSVCARLVLVGGWWPASSEGSGIRARDWQHCTHSTDIVRAHVGGLVLGCWLLTQVMGPSEWETPTKLPDGSSQREIWRHRLRKSWRFSSRGRGAPHSFILSFCRTSMVGGSSFGNIWNWVWIQWGRGSIFDCGLEQMINWASDFFFGPVNWEIVSKCLCEAWSAVHGTQW